LERAPIRAASCLDINRRLRACDEEGGCGLILSLERFELPACSIEHTYPVSAVDDNRKVGWSTFTLSACGFQDRRRVLPESAHTPHIGRLRGCLHLRSQSA